MPTPITMYRTQDGRVLPSLKEAIAHEQNVFFNVGLVPLFQKLLAEVTPEDIHSQLLVDRLAADSPLLAEFRKFFSKVPQDTSPVAPKRSRRPKTKAAVASPESPGADTAPFKSTDPSEAELAALDSLAGAPIVLPADDDTPPPAP